LREQDISKVQSLNRTASEATVKILGNLYKMPIVGIADIVKWTNYTRRGAYNTIERLIEMEILSPLRENTYAQKWVYRDYLNLFDNEDRL
jgi:hypothetical protein